MAVTHNRGTFTFWGRQETSMQYLALATFCFSLAFLVDAGIRAWDWYHGLPVYFVPPGSPGVLRPGVIPDGVAEDYAKKWFKDRYTFTPFDIKEVHATTEQSLHPALIAGFQAQAKLEQERVKQAKMSSQLVPISSKVIDHKGQAVTVEVEVKWQVWLLSAPLTPKVTTVVMTVVPWDRFGYPAGIAPIEVKARDNPLFQ